MSTTCLSNFAQSFKTVLLLAAVVQAFDKKNRPHSCRALLDNGSQVNFVTEEWANRHGFPKQSANITITGAEFFLDFLKLNQLNLANYLPLLRDTCFRWKWKTSQSCLRERDNDAAALAKRRGARCSQAFDGGAGLRSPFHFDGSARRE